MKAFGEDGRAELPGPRVLRKRLEEEQALAFQKWSTQRVTCTALRVSKGVAKRHTELASPPPRHAQLRLGGMEIAEPRGGGQVEMAPVGIAAPPRTAASCGRDVTAAGHGGRGPQRVRVGSA